MAITTINLTDPVSTLITKTNTISSNLGDVVTLYTGSSSVVAAINTLEKFVGDSATAIAIARDGLSVNSSNGGGMVLGYDSSTGQISITSNLIGGTGLTYDSAGGTFSITDLGVDSAQLAAASVGTTKIADNAITSDKMADSAVGSAELKNAVTLVIYDASGTAVKTLYGAGI